MEIGTRVVPRFDKIIPHIGTVIANSDGITVFWDHSEKQTTYRCGEVREIRDGELEKRIKANEKFLKRLELRKD